MSIQVFDPPLCCPTGVCGPAVDPELVRINADLSWLAARGVTVERFNLAVAEAAGVATSATEAQRPATIRGPRVKCEPASGCCS